MRFSPKGFKIGPVIGSAQSALIPLLTANRDRECSEYRKKLRGRKDARMPKYLNIRSIACDNEQFVEGHGNEESRAERHNENFACRER